MSLRENVISFWNRVSGKTLEELGQTIKHFEDRLNMLQLDFDAANIKLASTEIDLEASNIEKETLRIELEEKKAELTKLKMTIETMKAAPATSDELEVMIKKARMEEYLKEEYKKRLQQVVDMLVVMSQEPKYNDIIKIQTNSIDEIGREQRQVYISFKDVTIKVEETEPELPKTVTTPETSTASLDLAETTDMIYQELMEMAN